MPVWFLNIVKQLCFISAIVIMVVPNFANYYFVKDLNTQWDIVIISIAWIMFLLMVYVWISESIKKNKTNIILSGWGALYLAVNLGVVLLGYNLYTKGVIEMFTITTLAAASHLFIRLWQKS